MIKSLIINGNSKMGKKVLLFNLPPIITCTPTTWCTGGETEKPKCYALKGNFIFPSVKKAGLERLEASKKDNFVDKISEEIDKFKPKYFRFHSSGDFYSEKYVKKVIEIAKRFPNTLFRTTTRRRDLVKIISELNSLPNFIVRESLDTERSTPSMGLLFAAIDSLPIIQEIDSYKCKNNCPKCGYYCWKNKVNMHFKEH